jgi:hypothetical protein
MLNVANARAASQSRRAAGSSAGSGSSSLVGAFSGSSGDYNGESGEEGDDEYGDDEAGDEAGGGDLAPLLEHLGMLGLGHLGSSLASKGVATWPDLVEVLADSFLFETPKKAKKGQGHGQGQGGCGAVGGGGGGGASTRAANPLRESFGVGEAEGGDSTCELHSSDSGPSSSSGGGGGGGGTPASGGVSGRSSRSAADLRAFVFSVFDGPSVDDAQGAAGKRRSGSGSSGGSGSTDTPPPITPPRRELSGPRALRPSAAGAPSAGGSSAGLPPLPPPVDPPPLPPPDDDLGGGDGDASSLFSRSSSVSSLSLSFDASFGSLLKTVQTLAPLRTLVAAEEDAFAAQEQKLELQELARLFPFQAKEPQQGALAVGRGEGGSEGWGDLTTAMMI